MSCGQVPTRAYPSISARWVAPTRPRVQQTIRGGDAMKTRFATWKLLAPLFVSLVGLFLCASLAHTQAVTANISGAVMDASGAEIVGAQVVVTNTGTGVS